MSRRATAHINVYPPVRPIVWTDLARGRGLCRLLDQTQLPDTETYLDISTPSQMWDAIRRLCVRGAPAISIAASYGVVLGLLNEGPPADLDRAKEVARRTAEYLATSRPTAVNLFWALDRIKTLVRQFADGSGLDLTERLLAEARAIHQEDGELCSAIGLNGADIIKDGMGVLTHCNTGALATGGIGTAIGVITTAYNHGRLFKVYADETRPLLQGARLTAWELTRYGVDTTLICDNMAGLLMQRGMVNLVLVGADRIAANGDTANKIGTYSVAVLAHHHRVPFYVAAPLTSFDLALADGNSIPIETRSPEEVLSIGGKRVAPQVNVYSPAFDVTPHALISGIVTEAGVLHPPFVESIAAMLSTVA